MRTDAERRDIEIAPRGYAGRLRREATPSDFAERKCRETAPRETAERQDTDEVCIMSRSLTRWIDLRMVLVYIAIAALHFLTLGEPLEHDGRTVVRLADETAPRGRPGSSSGLP